MDLTIPCSAPANARPPFKRDATFGGVRSLDGRTSRTTVPWGARTRMAPGPPPGPGTRSRRSPTIVTIADGFPGSPPRAPRKWSRPLHRRQEAGMVQHDLYGTLGVGRDDREGASFGAHRDLTRCLHAASDARRSFLDAVDTAAAVLADARRRERYDRRRGDAEPRPRARAEVSTIDLLRDIDGTRPSRAEIWSVLRSNFVPGATPKSGRIALLDLTLEGASSTLELILLVPVFRPCASCHGDGHIDAWPCATCDAAGLEEQRAGVPLPAGADEPLAF